MKKFRKFVYIMLLLCIIFWFLTIVAEANKTGKVAKNILKAAVVNSAMGKAHKPYHKRGFPTWAIVLLVIGGSSVLGLTVFLFCLFRRQQSCWRPTHV